MHKTNTKNPASPLPNAGHQLSQYPIPPIETTSPDALAILSRELIDSGSMTLHTMQVYMAMLKMESRKDRNGLAQRNEDGTAQVEFHRLSDDGNFSEAGFDQEQFWNAPSSEVDGCSRNIAHFAGLYPPPVYPKDASTALRLKESTTIP